MKTKIIYRVLFSMLAFILMEDASLAQIEHQIGMEYIDLSKFNLTSKDQNDYLIVLMNQHSQVLVDGKKCTIDEVENIIMNKLQNKISGELDLTANRILKPGMKETVIYVQKDFRTNQEDFKLLTEKISTSISNLQIYYANMVYGENYKSLKAPEKEKISIILKPTIYIGKDWPSGGLQKEQVMIIDSIEVLTKFKTEQSIIVHKGVSTWEYVIQVKDQIPDLKILIEAETKSGNISFRIYDPIGKIRDNLSLKPTLDGEYYHISKDLPENQALFLGGAKRTHADQVDKVAGRFLASYNNPIQGEWIIIVDTEKADGFFNIYQVLKNKD